MNMEKFVIYYFSMGVILSIIFLVNVVLNISTNRTVIDELLNKFNISLSFLFCFGVFIYLFIWPVILLILALEDLKKDREEIK